MPNKSGNYPEEIPSAFAQSEALSAAYRKGWNHGHGFACHNVPTLGTEYRTDGLGRVTADADNIREIHESLCYEAEGNSRQFSPFEFLAHEFNSAGEGDDDNPGSDELWEAFEQGARDSIAADLATYSDEDYGISEDSNEDDE